MIICLIGGIIGIIFGIILGNIAGIIIDTIAAPSIPAIIIAVTFSMAI
jgi:putative ABC transport system permease protein